MSSSPLILLPPSESKAIGGQRESGADYFSEFLTEPRAVLNKALGKWLRTASDSEISKVFKVRGPLLERAIHVANAHAAGKGLFLPAWQRYEGVVWSHLDPQTLSAAQRRRILIPSGLYGINRGDDLIEDYRLTMNVSLPGLGNVAAYWRDSVTAAIESTKGPIVSLLPNEHLSVVNSLTPRLETRFIHVSFVAANGVKAAGHDAKAVKGVVARAIIERGVEALEGFNWFGWSARLNERGWTVTAPKQRSVR